MSGKLILARHHESEWNKLGKWTGLVDKPLTPYGTEKAEDMGLLVKDMSIDQIGRASCRERVCELV